MEKMDSWGSTEPIVAPDYFTAGEHNEYEVLREVCKNTQWTDCQQLTNRLKNLENMSRERRRKGRRS